MDGSVAIKFPDLKFADGVYFDLPFEDYLSEKRLSFHGCKDLLISSLTYWSNALDPDKEDVDTKAKRIGRAFHTRILEGEAVFRERFAIKPENDGEYAEGNDEMKALCADLGLTKGGTAPELCARILEKDPDAKLWAVHLRQWLAENSSKDLLTEEQWRNVEKPARMVAMHPHARNAFQGGYPEVSIFWTDPSSGVPMKTRADYLKVKDIIELKTFSNPLGKPIDAAVAHTLGSQKYHVQGRILLEGVDNAKRMVREGKVSGSPDPEWLKEFSETPEHTLSWVFIQQGRVPEIRIRQYQRYVRGASAGSSENHHWVHGLDCFIDAIRIYCECMEHYGPDLPWINQDARRPFVDDEFPPYVFN